MRPDAWLAERLGQDAWTVEDDDDGGAIAARGSGFFQAKVPAAGVARVAELEDAGLRTIDVNVTLARKAGPMVPDGASSVRDTDQGDREAVLDIAERDFTVSRFHLDPLIPDAAARRIKRDWVENFFLGARGDRLLVADLDGSVAGFLLVVERDDAAVIDLIAVAAAARGRGVGAALVASLADAASDRPVRVGTQVANVGALRFYERLGFFVEGTQFVLHGHA